MNQIQYNLLLVELARPIYASMTTQQVSDALNAPDAAYLTLRESITVPAFIEALDWPEFELLTAAQKSRLQLVMFAGTIPSSGRVRTLLDALFPSGVTRNALIAAFRQPRSWAEANGVPVDELDIRRIRNGQVLIGESWTAGGGA